MPNFIGQPCTSCRNIIASDEDIVVCPDCGSPYHRECYIKEGKCINTALHESCESWKPELPQSDTNANNSAAAPSVVACKNCGAENSSDDAFCKGCGAPINMEKAAGAIYERVKQDNMENDTPFAGSVNPFPNLIHINKNSDVDGITVGEFNGYVGQKWFYFLPKFMRFSRQNSKVSFNFCAFLFPHLYFFYRKMIPMGILMLIATAVLSLPSTVVSLIRFGYLPSIAYANTQWFANLLNVSSLISYILDIVAGLFANWLYYKKAKTDIEKIKSTVSDDGTKRIAIANAGGTSWQYVLSAVIAMSAFSMLFIFLLYKMIGM